MVSLSRVLGIDPGSGVTGFGLVEASGRGYRALDYGCIRPPTGLTISQRRLVIFEGLCHLMEAHQPGAVAIETQYVHHNAQTAMKLGMVRGIAILAATSRGIPAYEYPPARAKQAVSGRGQATKGQIQAMVQKLLGLSEPPTPEDAADALALAICHIHASQSPKKPQEV